MQVVHFSHHQLLIASDTPKGNTNQKNPVFLNTPDLPLCSHDEAQRRVTRLIKGTEVCGDSVLTSKKNPEPQSERVTWTRCTQNPVWTQQLFSALMPFRVPACKRNKAQICFPLLKLHFWRGTDAMWVFNTLDGHERLSVLGFQAEYLPETCSHS